MTVKYRPRDKREGAHELAQQLAKNIDILAEELLGPPVRKTRDSWRWGARGSFVVNVAGTRRGRWYSFEDYRGGDALDLIERQRGGDLREAMVFARAWLGGAS